MDRASPVLELRRPRLSPGGASWYPVSVARASVESTFAEQVLDQINALHGFAFRLTRDAHLAEDLVQDTFARAIAAAAQFRPGTNLRAWLFRILRNAHIDGQRRARRGPLSWEAPAEEASTADVAAELLRGDLEIDRLRRRVAEEIEAALLELSEDARSVILLDLEGFSEAEIAEVMGCAIGTVKSRLARARAALRLRLAEYAR